MNSVARPLSTAMLAFSVLPNNLDTNTILKCDKWTSIIGNGNDKQPAPYGKTNDPTLTQTHLLVVHSSDTVMSRFSVQEENKRHSFTLASVFIFHDCNPGIRQLLL